MATVAKWITKGGQRIYLKKGGANNVHNDFYRVEGAGIKPDDNQRKDAYHFLDKKHALEVAKANVRVKDFRHDSQKYGFDHARTQKDKLRVGALQREIRQSKKITSDIYAKHRQAGTQISGKDMDTLDHHLHTRPYKQTELENLGGREL
jgi:hypothetical protein